MVGLVLAVVGWWLRRGEPRSSSRCATSRSTAGCAAAPRSSRSCARPRPSTTTCCSASAWPSSPRPRSGCGLEEAHVAEIDQRRARLSGLIGDEPLERAAGPARHRGPRDRAEDGGARGPGADRQGAAGAGAPRGRGRRRRAPARARRDDEANARARVEQNPVDAEEVAALAERLADGPEALAALRRRERVYARTLAEINAAEQATMQRATRYLERRMVQRRRARSPTAATGASASTTPTSAMDVFSPERGDWVPVTDLSQGTLDVVYLAARIGLVRLVTGDRRPPLVLDDPFVTLDDGRAAARAGAAARARRGLPGDLPHDVGPLRRAGRAGHRPRRARRPSTPTPSRRGWPLPEVAGTVRGPRARPRLGGHLGGGRLRRRAAQPARAAVRRRARHAARRHVRGARDRRSCAASRSRRARTSRGRSSPGSSGSSASPRCTAAWPSAGWASSRRRRACSRAVDPGRRRVRDRGRAADRGHRRASRLALVAVVLVTRAPGHGDAGPSGIEWALLGGVGDRPVQRLHRPALGRRRVRAAGHHPAGPGRDPAGGHRRRAPAVADAAPGGALGRRRRPARHDRQRRVHPGRAGRRARDRRDAVVALPGGHGDPGDRDPPRAADAEPRRGDRPDRRSRSC